MWCWLLYRLHPRLTCCFPSTVHDVQNLISPVFFSTANRVETFLDGWPSCEHRLGSISIFTNGTSQICSNRTRICLFTDDIFTHRVSQSASRRRYQKCWPPVDHFHAFPNHLRSCDLAFQDSRSESKGSYMTWMFVQCRRTWTLEGSSKLLKSKTFHNHPGPGPLTVVTTPHCYSTYGALKALV